MDWAHMRHLVLPAVTLAVVPIGIVARTVRALAGDILSMDFVTALYARASAAATCCAMWPATPPRPPFR
ncbi:hypothetical protein FLP41_09310 [Paracoccus marcusii]|uniref:hypothetical protein n=1 Tax=Paracoccus marcusii TaxID=59779 RepID=UPI002ED65351|nr:hypothetical protein FLP41_09310 [Paracoccus marcusii]